MEDVKLDFEIAPGGGGPLDSLAFLLSQLGFVAARGFNQALAPLGLEPRHFLLLRFIARSQGRSQQALAELLGIPASRMVALVDNLEQRGLVERRPNPSDRRARALYLTPAGGAALEKAIGVAIGHERAYGTTLSAEERRTLIGLLQKLAAEKRLLSGVHPGFAADDAGGEDEGHAD